MRLEIGSVWLLDRLTFLSIFRMSQTAQTGRLSFIFLMWLLCMPPQSSCYCENLGMPLEMNTTEMNTTSAMEVMSWSCFFCLC